MSARIVVKPVVAVDSEDKQYQQQLLTYLIGHDLEKEASDRLDELTFTRRKLASPRRLELRSRNNELYATEPWVTHAPIPSDLQYHLKRKLSVTLHYMSKISFSVMVDYTATPSVLLQVCKRVFEDKEIEYDNSDPMVLKVAGREEFLTGSDVLHDFLWVRHCMKTNQELHLSVVPWSHLPDDTVKFVDWPLVDGFSGQFNSHEDLRLDNKDLDDIFMISLWDCNRKLRVKLLGFDMPKLPDKYPQSVYIEASILYGGKVLSSVSSTPKAFAEEVLWNEWLEFDVLLSDLPRGAKLGFTINDTGNDNVSVNKELRAASVKETQTVKDQKSARSKDSRKTLPANKTAEQPKGKGNVLYFVNLLLIDHR